MIDLFWQQIQDDVKLKKFRGPSARARYFILSLSALDIIEIHCTFIFLSAIIGNQKKV